MDRISERRQGVARLIGLHDDDGSFDRAFWARIRPSERLAMVWDMVQEAAAFGGRSDARQRGLQRSVCRIQLR